MFRGKESSNNRIILISSRVIEFWCFWLPAALGGGWVHGRGGWGGWVGGREVVGVPPTHVYMHMHTHTHTCTHMHAW